MPDAHVLVKDRSTPPPVRRVLTLSERESLTDAARVFGWAGEASEQYQYPTGATPPPVLIQGMRVNRPRLNEQQQRVVRVLREGLPEPVAPADRDRLEKRCEVLEAMFTPVLQTHEELRAFRHRNPDAYFKAQEYGARWQRPDSKCEGRTPQDVAEEWRNLKRRLDPDNPEADSLDRLRRKRREN